MTEEDKPVDLNMIEIMTMERKMGTDSRFVNGLVLDHGGRHPDMPKVLNNCHIMTCNVTFEYEKTEVQSGFFYSNAEEREKLVESERKWLDERCKAVIDFKRSVCKDGQVCFIVGFGFGFIFTAIARIALIMILNSFLRYHTVLVDHHISSLFIY